MAVEPEALALLGELGGLLDKLSGVDLTGLAGDELLDLARDWETVKRRGAVLDHRLVAELDARQLGAEKGVRSTAALLWSCCGSIPGRRGGGWPTRPSSGRGAGCPVSRWSRSVR